MVKMKKSQLVHLSGKSKKDVNQRLREVCWIIENLSMENAKLQKGDGSIKKYNKWLTKWHNWKKTYPNYASQIEIQLDDMETIINV